MAINSQPSSPRSLLVSTVLSWIGVVICFLLVQASAGTPLLLCARATDCQAVLSSRFSAPAGIPLAVAGATFYSVILTTLLLAWALPSSIWRRKFLQAALWLCVVGVSYSAGLMGIQFLVLHAFCPLCTASAAVLVALTSCLVLAVRSDPEEFRGSPHAAGAFLACALVGMTGLYLPLSATRNEVVAEVDGTKLLRRQMDEDLRKEVWPLKARIQTLETDWMQKNIDATAHALERRHLPQTSAGRGSEPASPGKLEHDHDVRRLLNPFPAGPVAFDDRLGEVLGPPDARVELVVFSDFTCRYCIELDQILRRIRNDFPQLKFVYRDFPLTDQSGGFLAAIAGRCASEQGAFWAYQDKLFEQRGLLPREKLIELAVELRLDQTRFVQHLESAAARAAVTASVEEASRVGVPGTPSLYLNGRLIGGTIDFENLRKKISVALENPLRPAAD